MAKLPVLWLQGASQKMAGAVVYQQAGRTLGRSLAASVSNPRTTSQMAQRVRLANLVQIYKASRRWMPLAFESKLRTWSDYNAFVSANLAQARVYLTKSQAAAGAAVIDAYKVADGSLNPITQNVAGSNVITDLYTGDLESTENISVAAFSEAMLANNNTIQEGDQLSMIQYIQQTAEDGTPFVVCRAYEVVLSTADTRQLSLFMPATFIVAENSGNYCIACACGTFTGGVAFILSRTVASGTRVSRAYVTLTPGNTFPQQFSTAAALTNAIESYGDGADRFLESTAANTIQSSAGSALSVLSISFGSSVKQSGENYSLPIPSGTSIQFNMSSTFSGTPGSPKFYIGPSMSNLTEFSLQGASASGAVVSGTAIDGITHSGISTGSSYFLVVEVDGVQYGIRLYNQGNSMD